MHNIWLWINIWTPVVVSWACYTWQCSYNTATCCQKCSKLYLTINKYFIALDFHRLFQSIKFYSKIIVCLLLNIYKQLFNIDLFFLTLFCLSHKIYYQLLSCNKITNENFCYNQILPDMNMIPLVGLGLSFTFF